MPGYDEKTVRESRNNERHDDPDREARRMDRGAAPDAGAGESIGVGAGGMNEDLGGIGGTGMTDAEAGGSQSRLTPGIGAAGDPTDEDLLEDR